MRFVAACAADASSAPRAVVVDAIDQRAAEFYRHFDFHPLDERRLWRRLADIERALG